MAAKTIDVKLLEQMFLAGAMNLEAHKEWINELNVFPVPDGDTGTNMCLTVTAAVRELEDLDGAGMSELCKAMSSGSLRGARGNSGVILSQLLRGFTRIVRDHERLDVPVLAEGMKKATETAYKAVMKPKEGTILTVARGVSEKAEELAAAGASMEDFLTGVVREGSRVLAKTPDMLPVLKDAGVVDAGGQGLITMLEGALLAYLGKIVAPESSAWMAELMAEKEAEDEIRFPYSMQMTVTPEHAAGEQETDALQKALSRMGENALVSRTEGKLLVMVDTDKPGEVLTKVLGTGALSGISILNRALGEEASQNSQPSLMQPPQAEWKEVGFISVSVGNGFAETFSALGVDYQILGGQTMNPSTEDVLHAISQVPAKNIFVFPNNKNIIMAANQARDLTEDKNIIVIPTKTIPQGITAVISYDPEMSVEDNTEMMTDNIHHVMTGQVTYAVRDTKIDDFEIRKGDIMALGDNGLLAVGSDISEITKNAIRQMADESTALISIYYGEDFPAESAEAMGHEIGIEFPGCDVEVSCGGQPIYYCIVSVE